MIYLMSRLMKGAFLKSGARRLGQAGRRGGAGHQGLGAGDVVDGGDHAALDLEALVDDLRWGGGDDARRLQKAESGRRGEGRWHLDDGREAVGRAGGGGADGHVGGELVVVDADDDVEDARLLHREAAHDLLHPGVDVGHDLVRREEHAGALEDDFAAEVFPRDGFDRFFV